MIMTHMKDIFGDYRNEFYYKNTLALSIRTITVNSFWDLRRFNNLVINLTVGQLRKYYE
jgi:hypothetical protein